MAGEQTSEEVQSDTWPRHFPGVTVCSSYISRIIDNPLKRPSFGQVLVLVKPYFVRKAQIPGVYCHKYLVPAPSEISRDMFAENSTFQKCILTL